MSHTTIYFLAEAESYDYAESKVTEKLEKEHFFDFYEVLPESSGSFTQKRDELLEYVKDWDWKKDAGNFLQRAEQYKADGLFKAYGYNLISAGELYAQYLTVDAYAYNIDNCDYSIPKEGINWWVIAIDFHY
jgi:hypothetical protein